VVRNGLKIIVILLCGLSAAEADERGSWAVPVVASEAQNRMMAPVTWVAGNVVSRDEADIAAEVEGRLTFVAEEGVVLAKGDILARIDDVLVSADVAEAKAEVAREKANLKFLKREVERLQRLAKQNNAAQTQLDRTLADRDITVNELAAAEARMRVANERLARSELKAPFAGVLAARFKRSGEWVKSGELVVQLVDPDNLEVTATAPLSLRPYLTPGAEVAIQAGSVKGQAWLRSVVPVADAQSRLMFLRLDLGEGIWTAGQPLRIALPTAVAEEVLAVPRDALVLRRSGSHLFRVNAESIAEQVSVQAGIASGDYIQVMGDLAAGDKVVVRGNERLRPGQSVSVKGGAAE
jgi:RND family efflux transporter MFP subunit